MVIIHPDLDKFVLETFDKLDALTSTLISEIDDAYLQQFVELAALTTATSKISAQSSLTVNTPSFTTTSSIVSTTIHSPKLVINQPYSFHHHLVQLRPVQALPQAPQLYPLVKT